MKLKAVDSFYTDETGGIAGGKEFEIASEETGYALIKKGLAATIEGEKMDSAPANKAAARPQNKEEAKPSVKVSTVGKAK